MFSGWREARRRRAGSMTAVSRIADREDFIDWEGGKVL
jgi:hypothetical protein